MIDKATEQLLVSINGIETNNCRVKQEESDSVATICNQH